MSAYIAGLSGANVILVEEDYVFGGNINNEEVIISKLSGKEWVNFLITELKKLSNVRCMSRTCVIGMFDHGNFGVIEKFDKAVNSKIDQMFWKIISKKTMLCTGAIERLIPFQNNDRPGIMLSGSIRSYLNRWGIKNFKDGFVTNNDDAYSTAKNLISLGVNVVGIIDTRENPNIDNLNIKVFKSAQVTNSRGSLALQEFRILKNGKIFEKVG